MRYPWRHTINRISIVTFVTTFTVGTSGCSVHPLPEDVSRPSTVDIVKSIRCEALAGFDNLKPEEKARAAPIIRATVIGYDFTFNITETNGANGAGDPKNSFLKFQNGNKFTADLTGSASLRRQNIRRFHVIEPLVELANPENRAICSKRTVKENWTYPIAGTIGLDEVVRTYLRLEMLRATSVDNLVFADDLTFITYFQGGATNSLMLDAVAGKLKVTNASINVGASRNDTHQVTVALTRKDVSGAERPFGAFRRAAAMENRLDMLANDSVRDPRTQALLIKLDEDARTRVAMELYRRHDLKDIDNAPAEAMGQRLLDVLKVP